MATSIVAPASSVCNRPAQSLAVSPISREGLMKVGEVSSLYGVSVQTLRLWSKAGKLRVYRTPGGHRLIARCDIEGILGIQAGDNVGVGDSASRVLVYGRCSGRKQAKGFSCDTNTTKTDSPDSDLSRQVATLQKAALDRYGVKNPVTFSDIGSGLSYTRRGFERLMKEILAQKHRGSVLLLTFKDRCARFGFEMIEWICEAGGVRIEFVSDEPDKTEESEMAENLMSIIHVFSCRHYAKRGAISNSKELSHECLARAKALYDSGLPIQAIVGTLREEGFTATKKDGSTTRVSRHVLEKFLLGRKEIVEQLLPKSGETQNSFLVWKSEHLEKVGEIIDPKTGKASRKCRLRKSDLMEAYSKWYKKNGKKYGPKLSAMAIARHTKEFKRKLDRFGYVNLCGCQLK